MDAAARRGLASGSFEVLFTGLEEGRVEAALHAVPAGKQAALTGLESSVVDGEGFGIEPFRSGVCSHPMRYAVHWFSAALLMPAGGASLLKSPRHMSHCRLRHPLQVLM